MNMPIGVIVNSLAVLFGGLLGAILGNKIPERLRTALPLTFGVASMSMGISYIIDMQYLPAVVLALIIGAAIGELIKLEKGIEWCATKVKEPVERMFGGNSSTQDEGEFMGQFVGILVLFCASGTGVFGALNSGMTGDHTVLLAKSILDFFTAGIFGATLGYLVATICVPQFIILLGLFLSASLILPLATPAMIADFTALGGMIMLATGLRISGIKAFPIANMLPALVIVMPITYLWVTLIAS